MLKILITSANTSSLISTVYSLRSAHYCHIIGVDRKRDNLSRHVVNTSYVLRQATDAAYIKKIKQLCEKYHITMVIPHSISDRLLLWQSRAWFAERHITLVSSSAESIMKCERKDVFFEACKEVGIPLPEQYIVSTKAELEHAAQTLGYPMQKVVVKPVRSKGSRGFRILNASLDAKQLFYSSRGDAHEVTLAGLLDILGDEFASLIVSEYLPGREYSVDCYSNESFFLAVPRERTIIRNGLTHHGRMIEHKGMVERCRLLARHLGLQSIYGFQFKKDRRGNLKMLECNARIQGTMIMSTLAGANLFELALQDSTGQKLKKPEIDWTMEFQRIPGGMSIGKKKQMITLELH